MTVLVLSDSHGDVEAMARAVEKTNPDLIVHLGDCWRDAEELRMLFPRIPMEQVPGNCDFRPNEATEKLRFWGDLRVLMCHGHTYGVKSSLMAAGYAAEEKSLDLFLFGHTHRPLCDWRGKTTFFNPGSIGKGLQPTYGVLHIEGGKLSSRILPLE